MKARFFTFILLFSVFSSCAYSQAGMWTWMKGTNAINGLSNYGTMGVALASNEPPSRYAPLFWTDTSGSFWIYGGAATGYSTLSDLWTFNPTTQMWTWMNGLQGTSNVGNYSSGVGVFSAIAFPGGVGYGSVSWVTNNNHLWFYGGGTSSGTNADLWQYDPAINQWAWMGGGMGSGSVVPVYGTQGVPSATNTPGSRYDNTSAWTDASDNLWLFGGLSAFGSSYADLWKYDIATGWWIWMSGSSAIADPGVYGSIGTPSTTYYPGARITNFYWKDAAGNFWLIGGENYGANTFYEDVWMFNPNTLEWTLIKGSSTLDTTNYSSGLCSEAPGNFEGGRFENRGTWKICDNLIVNYGGYQSGYGVAFINDMWAYVPSLNDFVRISQGNALGSYGIQGVAAGTNFPPERIGECGFMDKNNNVWMFGGRPGPLAGSLSDTYNDLWKYIIDTACIAGYSCVVQTLPLQANANATPSACGTTCTGIATVNAQNGTPPYHYLWNPTNDTIATVDSLCAGTYFITVTDAAGVSVTDSVVVTAPSPISAAITSNQDTICANDSAQICAPAGFVSYSWNVGGATQCIIAQLAGNYYVTVTDNFGCTAESNHIPITVLPSPAVSISVNGDTLVAYNASSYQWYLNGNPIPGANSQTYIATLGGSYSVVITDANGCPAYSTAVVISAILTPTLSQGEGVEIFPNLSSGSWQLAVGNNLVGGRLEIFDAEGRLVLMSNIEHRISNIELNAARGIYLMRIVSEKQSFTRKLIKL